MKSRWALWAIAAAFATAPAHAQQEGQGQPQDVDALAKQLSNPIANLISLPIQTNFDFGAGSDSDGFGFTANVQPVVPVLIGDVLMISRTIVPISYRDYLPTPGEDTFGLGDVTQSLFFSPA